MCQAILDKGEFDPELCPLLKGLSPEQIAVRMKQEPFVSCVRRLEVRNRSGELEKEQICPALHGQAEATA